MMHMCVRARMCVCVCAHLSLSLGVCVCVCVPRAGVVGICAAALGASVTMTDFANVVPVMQSNIDLNQDALAASKGIILHYIYKIFALGVNLTPSGAPFRLDCRD